MEVFLALVARPKAVDQYTLAIFILNRIIDTFAANHGRLLPLPSVLSLDNSLIEVTAGLRIVSMLKAFGTFAQCQPEPPWQPRQWPAAHYWPNTTLARSSPKNLGVPP
jgi:hypothetical protein